MHIIEIAGNIDATTVHRVREGLEAAAGEPVTLRINSEGGSAGAGSQILTHLKDYPGRLTARIGGSADSMASLVAASCDRVIVGPDSEMLIHRTSGPANGNVHKFIERAENLLRTDRRMAAVYAKKSGRPADFWEAAMDKSITLQGQKIIDFGLADEMATETTLPEKPAPPTPQPEPAPQPQGKVPLAALWGEARPKTNTGILFIF
jgi:ATP-dependent Clp protease, protease subunit